MTNRQVCNHRQWPPGPTLKDLTREMTADDIALWVTERDALAAEVEALRADVAEWKRVAAAQSAEIERLQAEVETGDYNWNRFIEPINSYFVYKPGFVIRPESARESEGGPYASHPCGAAKNIMCYVDALEARAERLAEVLELMVTTHDEGGWPSATIAIARAALAQEQEQENKS